MKTFVVRIYGSNPRLTDLRGVVDEVASGVRDTFHDAEGLLQILSRAPGRGSDDRADANTPRGGSDV
jgi:hypothetical protein